MFLPAIDEEFVEVFTGVIDYIAAMPPSSIKLICKYFKIQLM